MKIQNLSIEITRRCNLKCRHCCRGNAENKNIKFEYIRTLLDQVAEIGRVTFTGGEPSLNVPAIRYFLEECKRRKTIIYWFCGYTNAINIKQDYVDALTELHFFCKYGGSIDISDDIYHKEQKMYNDTLLKDTPFYRGIRSDNRGIEILREGRGKNIKTATRPAGMRPFTSVNDFEINYITLNVDGEVINGIDWSFDNQHKHFLCRVENLTDFYNNLK